MIYIKFPKGYRSTLFVDTEYRVALINPCTIQFQPVNVQQYYTVDALLFNDHYRKWKELVKKDLESIGYK